MTKPTLDTASAIAEKWYYDKRAISKDEIQELERDILRYMEWMRHLFSTDKQQPME